MSVQTIDKSIESLGRQFHSLNRQHFRTGGYRHLHWRTEKKICELAEEIARLQMTRSVMAAKEMTGRA